MSKTWIVELLKYFVFFGALGVAAGDVVILCQPGFEWVNGRCRPCDINHFRASPVFDDGSQDFLCTEKYRCSKVGMVTLFDGNRTNDRVCGCDFDQGFYMPNKEVQRCTRNDDWRCSCARRKCKEGEGMVLGESKIPAELVSAECTLCKNCTYAPSNGYGPCKNCSTTETPELYQTCRGYIEHLNATTASNDSQLKPNVTNDPDIFEEVAETEKEDWIEPMAIGLGTLATLAIIIAIGIYVWCLQRKRHNEQLARLLTPSPSTEPLRRETYEDPKLKLVDSEAESFFLQNQINDLTSALMFAKKCGMTASQIRECSDNPEKLCHKGFECRNEKGDFTIGELCSTLESINYNRLADTLLNCGNNNYKPTEEETEVEKKLDLAFEVVEKCGAGHWITLSRKLGHTQTEIEVIQAKHSKDLLSQCRKALELWKQKCTIAECTAEKLIACLRSAKLENTADEVEKATATPNSTIESMPSSVTIV